MSKLSTQIELDAERLVELIADDTKLSIHAGLYAQQVLQDEDVLLGGDVLENPIYWTLVSEYITKVTVIALSKTIPHIE